MCPEELPRAGRGRRRGEQARASRAQPPGERKAGLLTETTMSLVSTVLMFYSQKEFVFPYTILELFSLHVSPPRYKDPYGQR